MNNSDGKNGDKAASSGRPSTDGDGNRAIFMLQKGTAPQDGAPNAQNQFQNNNQV